MFEMDMNLPKKKEREEKRRLTFSSCMAAYQHARARDANFPAESKYSFEIRLLFSPFVESAAASVVVL